MKSGIDRREGRIVSPRTNEACDTPLSAARWEMRLAWLLRALIFTTAIAHAVQGELLYVLLCLAAIALVVVPAWNGEKLRREPAGRSRQVIS